MIDEVELREIIRQMHEANQKSFQVKQAAKNTGNEFLFREALEWKYKAGQLDTKINQTLANDFSSQ